MCRERKEKEERKKGRRRRRKKEREEEEERRWGRRRMDRSERGFQGSRQPRAVASQISIQNSSTKKKSKRENELI